MVNEIYNLRDNGLFQENNHNLNTQQYFGYSLVFNNSTSTYIRMPCVFNTKESYVCESFLKSVGDRSSAFYLQADSRLTWIRNDNKPLKDVQGVLDMTNVIDGVIYNRFMFGRIIFEEAYRLVVIRAEKENYEIISPDLERYKTFDILVCSPIANAPCGKFTM